MEFVNPGRLIIIDRDHTSVVDEMALKYCNSESVGPRPRTQDHRGARSMYFLPTRPEAQIGLALESDLTRGVSQRCIKIRDTVEQEYQEEITSFTQRGLKPLMSQPALARPSRNIHPALALAILKEKLAKRVVDIKTLFPAECFHFQGRILCHHFRDALVAVGIPVSDADFSKLWKRFDRHNVGMIQTRQFLKDVDLDMLGRPLHPASLPGVTASAVVFTDRYRPKTVQNDETKRHEHSIKQRMNLSCMFQTTEASKVNLSNALLRPLKGERVTAALLKGFRLYDPDDNGVISLNNFLHVLGEFAVVVPEPIKKFLSSSSRNGQWIHYKEYLARFKPEPAIRPECGRRLFTNREIHLPGDEIDEKPLLAEICYFPDTPSLLKYKKMEQREALRAVMMKIHDQVRQQHAYLKTYFQARDRMGLGHIATGEIKSVMDRMYWNLAENESDLLCDAFDLHSNGRFHYEVFMNNI